MTRFILLSSLGIISPYPILGVRTIRSPVCFQNTASSPRFAKLKYVFQSETGCAWLRGGIGSQRKCTSLSIHASQWRSWRGPELRNLLISILWNRIASFNQFEKKRKKGQWSVLLSCCFAVFLRSNHRIKSFEVVPPSPWAHHVELPWGLEVNDNPAIISNPHVSHE